MALTKCKECGQDVSKKAESCPHCGYVMKKKSSGSGCLTVTLLGIVAFVIFAIASVDSPTTSPTISSVRQTAPSTSPVPVSVPAPREPGDQWHYYQWTDEMSSNPVYQATVRSENTVNFSFPYSGNQRASLTLRTHPRYGKDLIFKIEKGQILCNSYEECDVLVRFDEAPAVKYQAIGPSDNSSESVFIRAYSTFAGNMLKAETVRISAPIYNEGNPTFTFDVSGFSVDKYRPPQ